MLKTHVQYRENPGFSWTFERTACGAPLSRDTPEEVARAVEYLATHTTTRVVLHCTDCRLTTYPPRTLCDCPGGVR